MSLVTLSVLMWVQDSNINNRLNLEQNVQEIRRHSIVLNVPTWYEILLLSDRKLNRVHRVTC